MKTNSLYVVRSCYTKQKYTSKIIFIFNCGRKICFSTEMICTFNFIMLTRASSVSPLTPSRILNAPCPVLLVCVKTSISYRFCVL